MSIFILIWKSVFFVNLIVKIKMHLNHSREKNFDRQNLLNFWDSFFRLFQFTRIKLKHFNRKFIRHFRVSKSKLSSFIALSFEKIPESMNIDVNEIENSSFFCFNDLDENSDENDHDDGDDGDEGDGDDNRDDEGNDQNDDQSDSDDE